MKFHSTGGRNPHKNYSLLLIVITLLLLGGTPTALLLAQEATEPAQSKEVSENNETNEEVEEEEKEEPEEEEPEEEEEAEEETEDEEETTEAPAKKLPTKQKVVAPAKPTIQPVTPTKPIKAPPVTQKRTLKGAETVAYPTAEIGVQGNWRKKKDWLKQTIDINENTQDIFADVQKYRNTFYEKLTPIKKITATFYQHTGFNKGEINSLFKEVQEDIDKAKKKTKELFSQSLSQIDEKMKIQAEKIKAQFVDAYSIDEKFKTYKNNFDQFKLDMQSVIDLEKSLNERLQQVDNQINIIRSKAKQSKTLSEKIWYVIDDLKARNIFYTINGIATENKNLQKYIKEDLSRDFDSIIKTLKQQIKKTAADIDNLEKQGLIVMNRADRIKQMHQKQKEELLKEKESSDERKKRRARKRKKAKETSWIKSIWEAIKTFFSSLWDILN